jgi:aspartyl-tRNA(Asn)/glutamyl-tRNA(Gln) amidotransferase subunit A
MLGTFVLSSGYYEAYYHRALKVRRLIAQDYDLAFDQGCDAIIMPASVGPAFAIGEKNTDPMALYLEDIYTVGVNLAGLPAISLPVGTVEVERTNLPVGMQLIGRAWCERELLLAAKMVEDVVAAHRWLEGLSLAV